MHLRQHLHDIKPKPGSSGAALTRRPVEGFEQVRDAFRRDPGAAVRDLDPHHAVFGGGTGDRDGTPPGRVLHGVVDEIPDDLLETGLVGAYPAAVRRYVAPQPDVRRDGLRDADELTAYRLDVYRSRSQDQAPRLDLRDAQKRIQVRLHAQRLAADVAGPFCANRFAAAA